MCWVHQSVDRYIVNLAAFHNAAKLRAVLPQDLWVSHASWPDRKQALEELGRRARNLILTKSQETKRKTAETKERKKEKARQVDEATGGADSE